MQIVVIAFYDKIELKHFFCVEFFFNFKLEGAQKYFNTLSQERRDRFKSKSEQVTCKAIFKGNLMLCSHANLKTRNFHANCFEYFISFLFVSSREGSLI